MRGWVAASLVILVAVGLGLVVFEMKPTSNPNTGNPSVSSTPAPAVVMVSGGLTLTGQGTQPTKLTFNSSGSEYDAVIEQGRYTVDLPNPGLYSIQLQWVGAFSWQKGTVNLEQVQLNLGKGSPSKATLDLTATTPNSEITLTGNIHTVGLATHATAITFTSNRDGEAWTAGVSGNPDYYSINLPNNATYTVQVTWTFAIGAVSETCSAGTLQMQTIDQTSSESRGWSC